MSPKTEVKRFDWGARDADGTKPLYVRAEDYDRLLAAMEDWCSCRACNVIRNARGSAYETPEERCDVCYHTREAHTRPGANSSHEFVPLAPAVPEDKTDPHYWSKKFGEELAKRIESDPQIQEALLRSLETPLPSQTELELREVITQLEAKISELEKRERERVNRLIRNYPLYKDPPGGF